MVDFNRWLIVALIMESDRFINWPNMPLTPTFIAQYWMSWGIYFQLANVQFGSRTYSDKNLFCHSKCVTAVVVMELPPNIMRTTLPMNLMTNHSVTYHPVFISFASIPIFLVCIVSILRTTTNIPFYNYPRVHFNQLAQHISADKAVSEGVLFCI